MATKEVWINLPVKDLEKSRAFYSSIGFKLNEGPGNTNVSASFLIGSKNVVLMLFSQPMFKQFTGNEVTETSKSNEVLFSIDAESIEEVKELANKAKLAGGVVFSEPKENQGWMYGCGFTDLDGHRWNVLYMDMSKMPK